MSNLEPIEEKDLDLKNKFTEKIPEVGLTSTEQKKETSVPTMEKPIEARQEGSMEKEKAYSRILSKVKKIQPPATAQIVTDAQSASQEATAEAMVDKLIALAMEKGVIHAVKVARHLEDNYTLDKFHDKLLADELQKALLDRGLIKQI